MKSFPVSDEFKTAFDVFLAAAQANINDYYARQFHLLTPPTLEAEWGQRYIKVICKDTASRSAFCFVDKTNGDVLKAASWKAPAKGKRGSIYAKDFSGYGVGIYGAAYLR